MRTFILEWRPAISSYKMEDFTEDIHFLETGHFNWSIWDWKEARSGDNFYMIKCGEGPTGIVMKGFFLSDPYKGTDWSGRGREVYYMDYRPTVMIHPDCSVGLLGTELLEKEMPSFQWNGGHSGRLLDAEMTRKLDALWEDYLQRVPQKDFDEMKADRNSFPEAGVDEVLDIVLDYSFGKVDSKGEPVILKHIAAGMAGKTSFERLCGFLGEVMEDPDYPAGRLRDRGVSEDIIDYLMQTQNQ